MKTPLLIKKCPKCGHARLPEEVEAPERCPACGVYFEKWANRHTFVSSRKQRLQEQASRPSFWETELGERLSHIPDMTRTKLYGYIAMLVFFTVWGVQLALMDYKNGEMSASFMHSILLPIHEAGHVFLMPLGEFSTILGGSLFQLLLPLIVAGSLLWHNRDPFGALLGLWWYGVSWMDLSAYIFDAKNPQLILLGGHTGEEGGHDWIYLLGTFGKIAQAHSYGAFAHTLGMVMMAGALIAATGVLWRNSKIQTIDLE